MDDWCDELIDDFKGSIDFDGIKEKLNDGLVAIQYIQGHKGELDSEIAQYENTHLTAENLSDVYYQNIKADIDSIKAKLGSLSLELYALVFAEGEVIIDLVLSNVETYSSKMDEIEATINENSLSEREYEELESYFISMKSEVGLGENDSINSSKYIELAKKMVRNLRNNNILKNSLPTQLQSLKNLPGEVVNHGLGGLVFEIDPVTLATEGAKNFWNFFKDAILDSNSLAGILANLPGDGAIDESVISAMPGNNAGDLVPADMTIDEFNNSVKNNGIFSTNDSLGQDTSIFRKIAELVCNTGNEVLDQLYLVEYIMTYFKDMVDVDTRMPVEYSGDTILENEIEAIINNLSYSDTVNKGIIVSKIMSIRIMLNFIGLMSNKDIMQILSLIEVMGPVGIAVKYTTMLGWVLMESKYDMMDILRGYSVPIIKNPEEWITKLFMGGQVISRPEQWNDSFILGLTDSSKPVVEKPDNQEGAYNLQDTDTVGLNYADMCRIQLLISSKDKLVTRAGNIIYANLNEGDRHFDCTEYFTGIKTSVGSDIKKWFNAETFNATGNNGGFKIHPIEIEKSYD